MCRRFFGTCRHGGPDSESIYICYFFHKALGAGFLLGKSEILHLEIEILGWECNPNCTFREAQREGHGHSFSAGRDFVFDSGVEESHLCGRWHRGEGGEVARTSLEVRHSGLRPS